MRLLLLLAIVLYPIPKLSAADSDFAKWWPQFQAAVAKADAQTVAQEAHFPLQWENGPIRQIKTEAELAQNFDKYFTPEIKKLVATKKPVKSGHGEYGITWKARGNEYTIMFTPASGGFALGGLSEGPP